MTKLGITPGVHGEDQLQKEDELTTVKIDPKVFTILQPVGTPPPTVLKAPLREQKSGACKWLMLITLISSATLLTLYLCSLYVADQPLGKIFVITTPEIETMATQPPQAEAQKSGEPVVILPVKTVDGGSENSSDRINDGAVIQQQQQQLPQQPDQPQFDPWVAAAQARFFQMQQEAQMWRWRRVQQALYEQQMMREQWQQQQAQQAYMAEQARAHWIARAQWEAAREEAGRAEQMRQVQMAQQAQQQEQEQAQQARAAQWQQYYWQQQQQQAQQAQQQQQQQQPQQQPQQDWQQYYWQQQQAQEQQAQQQMMMQQQQQQQQQMEQPQQPHHPRFILLRHLTRIQPVSLSFRMPEQPDNNELPQPAIHDRIYQQLQKKAQGMEFNAPNRPIWTAITPTPETPTTRFDEEAAFQENLKKSLEKEAQEATTPAAQEEDEKPHDLEGEMIKDIFSALASAAKDVDASTTTTEAPSTPASENVFKPFAGEQDKKIDEDVSIFKPFAPEEDKESDSDKAAEKSGFSAFNVDGAPKEQEEQKPEGFEPKTTMIDGSALPVVIFEDRFPKLEERTTTPETPMPAPSSAEVEPEEIHTEGEIHPSEMPTSAEMGPQDGPAPTESAEGPSSSEVPQDGPAPTMMIPEGTSSSEEHPAEAPMPSPEHPSSSEEHPAGPSSAETASEAPKEDENNEEHDPLAAFLKYFEQEARRMAEIRAAAAAEAGGSSDEMPVEGEAAQQPAVDEPEPHFKSAVPITV